MRSVAAIFLALIALSGCASTAVYNPAFVSSSMPVNGKLPGRAMILTTEEDDRQVVSQHPSSYTGAATTLNIQIGSILRNVVRSEFAAAFSEGAELSNSSNDSSKYLILVAPKFKSLDYKYNSLSNAGLAVTPQAEVTISVSAKANDGKSLIEKDYRSGMVSGSTYVLSGAPGEEVNKAIHQAISRAVSEALSDIRNALKK